MGETNRRLELFEGYGIELEYMIVDRDTLDVAPICDALLGAAAGAGASDFEDGPITWSNELALHVVELKTSGPVAHFSGLADEFARSLRKVDGLLAPRGARLMPTAMHPWMDPLAEMRLWPHENDVVYAAFDRIFDCRGHGWANLQSMHINFSFGEDASPQGQFARLHSAIRCVLPLLPALAASSPVVEGRLTGTADTRLEVYRNNSRRVPAVTGDVVPEPVTTRAQYEERILGRIYADMRELDPEGILRHEWCNARGAIARFDRSAIEIRVLDVQECPAADLAIATLVCALVRALTEGRWAGLEPQLAMPTSTLAAQLARSMRAAERAPVDDPAYLALFGLPAGARTAGAVWSYLAEVLLPAGSAARQSVEPALSTILERGSLSTRLVQALGGDASPANLRRVWGAVAECLSANRPFVGSAGVGAGR